MKNGLIQTKKGKRIKKDGEEGVKENGIRKYVREKEKRKGISLNVRV